MPRTVAPGDIVRVRDERWVVSRLAAHGQASIVDVTGCDRANRGVRARFILPFESIQPVSVPRSVRVVRPRRWRHLAREVLSAALPSPDALRAAASAGITIFPFQLEPALAVTRGLASRVLIADEVGLGRRSRPG